MAPKNALTRWGRFFGVIPGIGKLIGALVTLAGCQVDSGEVSQVTNNGGSEPNREASGADVDDAGAFSSVGAPDDQASSPAAATDESFIQDPKPTSDVSNRCSCPAAETGMSVYFMHASAGSARTDASAGSAWTDGDAGSAWTDGDAGSAWTDGDAGSAWTDGGAGSAWTDGDAGSAWTDGGAGSARTDASAGSARNDGDAGPVPLPDSLELAYPAPGSELANECGVDGLRGVLITGCADSLTLSACEGAGGELPCLSVTGTEVALQLAGRRLTGSLPRRAILRTDSEAPRDGIVEGTFVVELGDGESSALAQIDFVFCGEERRIFVAC